MKDLQCTAPRHHMLFLRFEDAIVQEFPCDIKDLRLRDGAYNQLKRWKKAGYFCYGFLGPGIFERSELMIREVTALFKKADRLSRSRVNGERFLVGVQICLHRIEDDCFCQAPTHGLLSEAVYTIMQFTKFNGMVRREDCIIVGDPKLDQLTAGSIGATFLDSDEWLTGSRDPERPEPKGKEAFTQ